MPRVLLFDSLNIFAALSHLARKPTENVGRFVATLLGLFGSKIGIPGICVLSIGAIFFLRARLR